MKKTFLKSLALAAVGSLFVAGSAMALSYSPDNNTIYNMTLQSASPTLDSSSGASTLAISWTGSVTKFAGTFNNGLTSTSGSPYSGPGFAKFQTSTNANMSSFDDYALLINNDDENSWDYSLWVTDGSHNYSTTNQTITTQSASTISLDLNNAVSAGVNLANITNYGFTIGATSLPLPGEDYTFETKVAPVPEPATMLLFGTGLAGLAGLRRRKAKKS